MVFPGRLYHDAHRIPLEKGVDDFTGNPLVRPPFEDVGDHRQKSHTNGMPMDINGHQWTSMNNANRQLYTIVKSFHYALARNPSSKRKSSATKKFLDIFRRKRKGDEQRDQKGSKGHKGSRTLKWTFHRAPNTPLISRFVDQIPRICIVEVTCGTAAWLPALR